ncbi:MAG: hypothetical protein ACOYY3_11390 [Chloroflexota bacterium]
MWITKKFLSAVCVLLAVSLAGCGPAVETRATPTVPPAPVSTSTFTPVPPTATNTSTPTATPIPISAFDMPDMLVTVSFAIPPEVAGGGVYEFVPYGSQYEKVSRKQNILPRYGQITLTGYPQIPDMIEDPAVRIFTVLGMADRFQSHVDSVHSLMAGGENPLAKLPTFPNLEVAALQTRLVKPLDFRNGSGFRYINFEVITEKGNPIPRVSVSYIFQGITGDDQFYVSAILPVDLPSLRQKAQEILLKAIANPTPLPVESYYPEILPLLEAAADEEFVPSLALLDGIIRSMEVVGR